MRAHFEISELCDFEILIDAMAKEINKSRNPKIRNIEKEHH